MSDIVQAKTIRPKCVMFDGRPFVEFRGSAGHPMLVERSSIKGIFVDELGKVVVIAIPGPSGPTLHEYGEVVEVLGIG